MGAQKSGLDASRSSGLVGLSRAEDLGFRVEGFGFRVEGFRGSGFVRAFKGLR